MPTLLIHHDVHAHLASLDVSIRDFIRQKVLWAKTQLAMTGRVPRVKGTRAQAWRRTPVRGNQYYLWWAPADEVGADSPDLGPSIAVRDLRHHDELTPPAPAQHSDYQVVHPREFDPRSALQASVAKNASPSGIAATIVRGQPGTGKTLSLLYAARDLAKTQRVLYVTYTPQLAEDALLFAKAVGIHDQLVVMTLPALEKAILREQQELPTENPSVLAQRFDGLVRSLDSSVVGAWSNKGHALWAEARACLVGMSLPFAWRRGPLTVPPGEILDLPIYCKISGLDADAAGKARHIADIARRRGLLADQTQARAALDALMKGETGDLPVEGVRAVLLDEAQDLTPIEFAMLLELPRIVARRDRAALFIAAGDESQTVHPSGFEWGIAKDLIRERLGREPKDVVLGQMMRSADAILSIINQTGSLYKALPKNFRPGGAVTHNAPPTGDAGRVLQCELGQNGAYDALIEALGATPGRALITLDKNARTESAAVTFTPAEIKGLERRIIVVTGLDETLRTLNFLTTRGAHESRSLESLEARYLIDGVRVAVSRATETLVLLRNDSGIEGLGRLPIDLMGGAEAIQWGDLLQLLRDDDLSDEERAEGFLAEAREHERRGDARRALERLERAEAIAVGLSDAELAASIRELRQRLEKKAGLRIVVAEEGGDFTSLQEAIDSAPEGALIQVRPGTYHGPFVIDKDIKIVGDGPRDSVVLEGDERVVVVNSGEVELGGLRIRCRKVESIAHSKWGAAASELDRPLLAKSNLGEPMAVVMQNGKLHVRGCEVTCEGGQGINGTMSHVHVEGCVVRNASAGILAGPDCVLTVERTEIKDVLTAIGVWEGSSLVLRESSVHDIEETGILLSPNVEARVENNDIRSVKHFAIFVSSGVTMVRANRIHQCYGGIKLVENAGGIFEENDIAESEHVGFWVGAGTDPTVRNNRIRNGGEYGIFIDPKGGGRFEENQILDNAHTGMLISGDGAIVVRNSLIQGNAKRYPSVHIGKKTVGVFEDNEVCKTQGKGIALHVDTGANFTVHNNRIHHNPAQGILCYGVDCVIEDNEIFENGDVGLGVEGEGSPKARRNHIHHNAAGIIVRAGASGVYEDNDVHTHSDSGIIVDDASGTFRRNRIRKGTRFGVIVRGASEPLFEENHISESDASPKSANIGVHNGANPTIRGNKIHSGAIAMVFHENAQGVVEDNEIAMSSTAGVFVKGDSTPILRGNRIHDVKGHAVVVELAGGIIENNEVFRNRGIGIRIKSTDAVVRGNRVHDNICGGIAANPGTTALFERNQIIGNKEWGLIVATDADPTVRNNRVQGSPHGIVACKGARGTYIGNDVRGNERQGLHLDPGSAPVQCEGNISDRDPVASMVAKRIGSKPSNRGHGKKKGRSN